MPETAQAGDTIVDLLRKILTNQAGTEVVQGGDGEHALWRKILINQSNSPGSL